MSDTSKIEWTDATWNPVRGCAIISKGCTNCYAMKQAHRFAGAGQAYEGLTQMTRGGPVWTGQVRMVRQLFDQPLRWKKPRRIFVNSMSDLFHENVPWEFIDAVFGVMAITTRHTYQILTKRPKRMLEYLQRQKLDPIFGFPERIRHRAAEFLGKGADNCGPAWPLKNVWLGVSAEDQPTADERVSLLLQTPAAVRWISAEPLLGPLNLHLEKGWCRHCNVMTSGAIEGHCMDPNSPCFSAEMFMQDAIGWVVAGGESGPNARPSHPEWFRSLRDQCAAAGVPFFFKQWGEWLPGQNELHPELRHATARHQDGTWGRTETKITDLNYVRWDAAGNMRKGGALGEPDCFQVAFWAERVGKKRAGRLLDGVLHDEYPAWLLNQSAPTPLRSHGWTCFHCGDTFKTPETAMEHFGPTPDVTPECVDLTTSSYQDLVRRTREAEHTMRRAIDERNRALDEAEVATGTLASIPHLFHGATSPRDAWNQFDSMQGRAITAEAIIAEADKLAPAAISRAREIVCAPITSSPSAAQTT